MSRIPQPRFLQSRLLQTLGRLALKATVPLLVLGIGILVAGTLLQVLQGRRIVPAFDLAALGFGRDATIFGVSAKLGGAFVIAGLVGTALRDRAAPAGTDGEPLEVPMSARAAPPDPNRPAGMVRLNGPNT